VDSLSALRIDLTIRSKWNVGYLWAGFFGASFPVLFWAFGDSIFMLHFIVRSVSAILIWFALPDQRFTGLPAFVAALYLVTAILLPSRRAGWLRNHAAAIESRPRPG
jgi:hypothetical protein